MLTSREKQILQLMAQGYSSKQIGNVLQNSYNTIANHRRNMLRKTEAKNSASLIRYAIENKII